LALSAIAQDRTERADEELLLSYRRSATEEAAAAPQKPIGAGAASMPTAVDNPLRPTNEPKSESKSEPAPVYRFAGLNSPPANQSADPPGVPVEAAPETSAEQSAPLTATAPAQTAPAPTPNSTTPESLPRYYDASVQPLAHAEPAAPIEHDEHEPKEAPLAVAELPSEALPLISQTASMPPVAEASRHLAPRSTQAMSSDSEPNSAATESAGLKSRLPIAFSKLESLSTAGAGLAIVVGLFFICMWLLRRSSGAKHSGALPSEAFAVLGRAPLTPQSFAQLLRIGNKLVLVAVSADGIQPLTEVIDPLEVDRLTAVCSSGKGHGPAAEFQQVLAQLAREPARGFLGAEANSGGRRRA
jgi:flagellar biogenesis protein FliO